MATLNYGAGNLGHRPACRVLVLGWLLGAVPSVVLAQQTRSFETPRLTPAEELRVRVSAGQERLAHLIAALPGVRVVEEGDYHLRVEVQDEGRVALYHPGGDRLAGRFDAASPGALLERIRRQAQVQALIDLAYPRQDFDLTLELPQGSGLLYRDQPFPIAASSDPPAVLLLLNIDTQGRVSVLYPVTSQELEPVSQLRETLEAMAPFGTEHLKLFAFEHPPPGVGRWLGREVDALDREFDVLLELLAQPGVARAQTRLKVVTVGELVEGSALP